MTQTPHIRSNPILREIAALLPGFEDITRGGPTRTDLDTAPRLDHWCHVARGPVPALAGIVTGHPILLDTDIVTSQLLWCDPAGGWARTRSRWYRLGPAATIIPEVLFRGRSLAVISPREAYEAMTCAPVILHRATRDLCEVDLAERLEMVCQAWPPKTDSGSLH